jgi:hypothetical protein
VKALFATVFSITIVVVGITALSAAGARKAGSRSVTFHLVEKDVGFNFIDNPPRQGFNAPPLMGDQFAFTSEVTTKAGAHAGSLDATCTITRGGNHGTGPCYGIYSFKGGQIMGIASLSFSSNVTRIVIVGGTGAYNGVTGTVVSVSRGDNSPFSDDTFHLVMP